MSKRNILIICYSYLSNDPRVLRQIDSLKDKYTIHTLGYDKAGLENFYYKLSNKPTSFLAKIIKGLCLLLRLHKITNRLDSDIEPLNDLINYDAIICNDLNSLPLGFKLGNGVVPIWIDLHEYSPKQFENYLWWRIFFQPYIYWQCKTYLPHCAAITTVCEGLKLEYEKEFNINIADIIYNAPAFKSIEPTEIQTPIRLVHHGGATPHRKLENMVELIKALGSGYSLDFYLMANNETMKTYKNKLIEISKGLPVTFHEPVPTDQIPLELNQYDIGLFLLEPVNFNYLHALPNKLFEFVQSRLCIAISPNPDMKSIVERFELGIVSDDYTPIKLADEIRKLTPSDIMNYKLQSHRYAEKLSSKRSTEVILNIMDQLLIQ